MSGKLQVWNDGRQEWVYVSGCNPYKSILFSCARAEPACDGDMLELMRARFPSRKFRVEPGVSVIEGSKWESINENPFERKTVTVRDVKEGYVLFEHKPMFNSPVAPRYLESCKLSEFLFGYRQV